MFYSKVINKSITIQNGNSMKATKIGKWKGTITQAEGSSIDMTLNKVKYASELETKPFSISSALEGGCQLRNKGKIITLKKGDFAMELDKIFPTKDGFVVRANILASMHSIAAAAMEQGKRIDINKAHKMLGHLGEDATTRKMASYYTWILVGLWKRCVNCFGQKPEKLT
jgi:hypothetical protein